MRFKNAVSLFRNGWIAENERLNERQKLKWFRRRCVHFALKKALRVPTQQPIVTSSLLTLIISFFIQIFSKCERFFIETRFYKWWTNDRNQIFRWQALMTSNRDGHIKWFQSIASNLGEDKLNTVNYILNFKYHWIVCKI